MPIAIRAFNDTETLGHALRGLRLSIPRTLSEMAAATKIQKSVLEAFETNDFAHLPPPSYARSFLRNYVRAMGGNEEYFLQRFDEECGACDIARVALLPPKRARTGWRFTPSSILKASGVAFAALAVAVFLGFEINNITSAPSLVVNTPADGSVTNAAMVSVSGNADPKATVQVNGATVLTDPSGHFETMVALERGLNVITVSDAKRYSRSAEVERHVILNDPAHTAVGEFPPSINE